MVKNHLDNLTIHKFRGLRDLELKDLGQVNLLVGVNNCGKTSVLEAINLYCDPLDIRSWLNTARQREREAIRSSLSPIDALQWLFSNDLLLASKGVNTGNILIQGSGEFPVKKFSASYEEISEISIANPNKNKPLLSEEEDVSDEENYGLRRGIELTVTLETDDSPQIEELQSSEVKIKLWEDGSLPVGLSKSAGHNLSVSTVTPSSHRSNFGQLRLFSEVRFANLLSEVVSLLASLDSNIINLEILPARGRSYPSFTLYIQHAKLGLSPVSTFGDGIRRLLHIVLNMARAKDGILLIDEIESTIHTEALQNSFASIVGWAKELNVQVFATTHSLEAIDAMMAAADTALDLVLYRLEPTEAKTRVVRQDWEDLKCLREELGQEVR